MILLEPFAYSYMTTAIAVSALTGALCAFLSAYLTLKGWSLMGDALSHAIVPGVAIAGLAGLPFALGAFASGLLAAGAMLVVHARTRLRQDAVIGLVFTGFFGLGLFIVSLAPSAVNVQTIVQGNVLAITPADTIQLVLIGSVSLAVLALNWRALMAVFFDENHARSLALPVTALKVTFFTALSLSTVAALQTVGAFLVVAMLVIPGATAYLLTDRFPRLIALSVGIGTASSALGAYASYFLDGATGGIIVLMQTAAFLAAFLLAPQHGWLAARRRAREAVR